MTLRPPGLDDGKRLRAYFQQAGYDLDTLRGGLGFTDLASFRYRKLLFERGSKINELDAIVRWFTCGMAIEESQVAGVVPAWVIESCQSCGMLHRDGATLRSSVMLSPCNGLLIASDLISKLDRDASDLIIWPNATTYQLMNASVSRGGAMLDLGCGTGVLAIAAAERSTTVTASDLNPRAAEFTAFNAALNGVEGIECRVGNCFEPVAGRKFDSILSNPPFFLIPSTGLLYCENPMELDLFARHLMRQAPAHLNESGIFQMLCEWVDLKGVPWRERLAPWAEDLGCDVWVLKTYTMTPIAYGQERCEQRPGGAAERDAAFGAWVDYYRDKGVEAVHGGLITLRRRSGRNWLRLEEDPTVTLGAPAGELILDRMAAQDLIQGSEDALLAARLCLDDRARLHQSMLREENKWAPAKLSLEIPGAFAREFEMDRLVAEFVAGFDGKRTLAELIASLAARVDAPRDQVASQSLAVARKLLGRGFLAPARARAASDLTRAADLE